MADLSQRYWKKMGIDQGSEGTDGWGARVTVFFVFSNRLRVFSFFQLNLPWERWGQGERQMELGSLSWGL